MRRHLAGFLELPPDEFAVRLLLRTLVFPQLRPRLLCLPLLVSILLVNLLKNFHLFFFLGSVDVAKFGDLYRRLYDLGVYLRLLTSELLRLRMDERRLGTLVVVAAGLFVFRRVIKFYDFLVAERVIFACFDGLPLAVGRVVEDLDGLINGFVITVEVPIVDELGIRHWSYQLQHRILVNFLQVWFCLWLLGRLLVR